METVWGGFRYFCIVQKKDTGFFTSTFFHELILAIWRGWGGRSTVFCLKKKKDQKAWFLYKIWVGLFGWHYDLE